MAVKVVSYNLHGFNQGLPLLSSLCQSFDIICIQEHWLYPKELSMLDNVHSDFVSVCTSALTKVLGSGVRHGRPFGGVGILIRKSMLSSFKCVARRERFIAIVIGNVLLFNVYMPVNTGTAEYNEEVHCVLSDIMAIIHDYGATRVIVGGDFNFNFATDIKTRTLFDLLSNNMFVNCDDVLELSNCNPVTFRRNAEHAGTFIDHFCVTRNIRHSIMRSYIIDSGDNLSDHLPICIEVQLELDNSNGVSKDMEHKWRLRWDKADLISYYYDTYNYISGIPVSDGLWNCLKGSSDNAQSCVDLVYDRLVFALSAAASRHVPCVKPSFYKAWWNDALSELKKSSIDAHNLWVACGRPRQGEIFLQMKSAKMAYKKAIKTNKCEGDSYFSNDLHDLLLSKDTTGFWRTWNAKMCGSKLSSVVDGTTDGSSIAQKFADMFQNNCSAQSSDSHSSDLLMQSLNVSAETVVKLLDIETVSKCLSRMKKFKAPGIDGIETEHLIYAHPLLVVQLCVMFNVMLQHSVVPKAFHAGIIIPVVKDKRGDLTDITNYRAITLSPCISKLFEMCVLELYGELLLTSSLQFGFKKKLSTSHALYTLRRTVDYYVRNGSTVNVSLLDFSKAFDNVHHGVLFQRLLDVGLPAGIVKLLARWYDGTYACVRWGSCFSACFNVTAGVRQGGVLSPVLFNVYVNSVIQRLQMSNCGCAIGSQFLGCIMYADDLVLLSPSVCDMQKMIDICVDEASCLNLKFNVKKSCVLRFGVRHLRHCKQITLNGKEIEYVSTARYLGVLLRAGRSFGVDLHFMKSPFYSSFNSIFHRSKKFHDELVIMHLVSAYCKPYLLYATDCIGLSVTQMRSIEHTWQCAISHIFHITGVDVQQVCNFTSKVPIHVAIQNRQIKFLDSLCHVDNTVLKFLFDVMDRNVLAELRNRCDF